MTPPTPPTPPPPRRGPGKPTKLTPEVQRLIVEGRELGLKNEDAAACAGVDIATFYNWMKWGREGKRGGYVEFFDAVTRATPNRRKKLLSIVTAAMMGGSTTTYRPDGTVEKVTRTAPDGRLALKMLSLDAPDQFAETIVVKNTHTGPGGGPVVIGGQAEMVAAMRDMSPDQIRAMLAATAPAGSTALEPLPDDEDEVDE